MTGDDPIRLAQKLARPALPKRSYRDVATAAADGGYAVLLDGRPARTPGGNPVVVPGQGLARAIAHEWAAQGETVDAAAMPLTRIVNTGLDGVAGNEPAVRAAIAAYAGSDLLCYRAEGPAALAGRQDTAWAPVLLWARDVLGARFNLAAGIVPVAQPPESAARVAAAVAAYPALPLAALHVATTLTGSVLLALAVAAGRLTAAEAWAAAHVDEDWQAGQWGRDAEAERRREARWRDMSAAALVLASARAGGQG